MKVVTKRVYVAEDGAEFDTQLECIRYEHKMPDAQLIGAVNQLRQVERRIFGHKRREDYTNRGRRTWYAGRKHAEALKAYREGKNRKDGEEWLDYLYRAGHLVDNLVTWRLNEKEAVEDLTRLRQERLALIDKIEELKKNLNKENKEEAR
jgi:hypothetical protein